MIDIVMSGMCKDCKNADLKVDSLPSYRIRCIHELACLAMKKKMQRQIPEEDPKGKSYTADEFCDKLKDFINQEHEKQGKTE